MSVSWILKYEERFSAKTRGHAAWEKRWGREEPPFLRPISLCVCRSFFPRMKFPLPSSNETVSYAGYRPDQSTFKSCYCAPLPSPPPYIIHPDLVGVRNTLGQSVLYRELIVGNPYKFLGSEATSYARCLRCNKFHSHESSDFGWFAGKSLLFLPFPFDFKKGSSGFKTLFKNQDKRF